MDCLRIKKVGKENTVYNVVSREQFERVYKPAGWVLDESVIEFTDYKIVEEPKTTNETIIKNIEKAKKVTNKKFDDKLIKEK